MQGKCAAIIVGLLVVWVMGCGDDKSTNSSGANSAVEAKIKQLLVSGEPGYPAKQKLKVTVSGGLDPQISWNGGDASQLMVYDVEELLQAEGGGDWGSLSVDGEMWTVPCMSFNCLSSPMTYGSLEDPDCCGLFAEYEEDLDTATEYVAIVTREEKTQLLWGYTTFTTPE